MPHALASVTCLTSTSFIFDWSFWRSATSVHMYQSFIVWHCNTLQHTATHCNTLQHATTRCNTLQHAATRCNKLQHTATHCNSLQHTTTTDLLEPPSSAVCVCLRERKRGKSIGVCMRESVYVWVRDTMYECVCMRVCFYAFVCVYVCVCVSVCVCSYTYNHIHIIIPPRTNSILSYTHANTADVERQPLRFVGSQNFQGLLCKRDL